MTKKPTNRPPEPIYIAGPTAVGKTAHAIRLAQELDGEVISVDSMQVYRGLDIGTAKPTLKERQGIPHHLIDVVDLTEPFDVQKFLELARPIEKRLIQQGKTPIYCGGTGLYYKALLEGLDPLPPSDPDLREQLNQTPLENLLEELQKTDPIHYQTIDRQNPRRIIRAIEIIRLTGKPVTQQRTKWTKTPTQNPPKLTLLTCPKEILHQKINTRVDQMFERGLVAETEHLLKLGLTKNPTAQQSLGYRQVIAHLNGETTLEQTIDQVKTKTRQYAKRQMTWFRDEK